MARLAFATFCCGIFLLGAGAATVADTACNGIVAVEVIETALGLTPVREICFEHGPSSPYFFDAPSVLERVEPLEPSVTEFEASQLEALGAYSLDELIDLNPIPPELRPKDARTP